MEMGQLALAQATLDLHPPIQDLNPTAAWTLQNLKALMWAHQARALLELKATVLYQGALLLAKAPPHLKVMALIPRLHLAKALRNFKAVALIHRALPLARVLQHPSLALQALIQRMETLDLAKGRAPQVLEVLGLRQTRVLHLRARTLMDLELHQVRTRQARIVAPHLIQGHQTRAQNLQEAYPRAMVAVARQAVNLLAKEVSATMAMDLQEADHLATKVVATTVTELQEMVLLLVEAVAVTAVDLQEADRLTMGMATIVVVGLLWHQAWNLTHHPLHSLDM